MPSILSSDLLTRRPALVLPVLALVAWLAIACSGDQPGSAATAAPATATAPAASAAPAATATARPEPTATPEPPTATPEPPTPVPPTAVPATTAPPPPPPPAPTPTPAPALPSGPVTLAVKGQVLAFNPRSLSVRTGASVTIAFENLDQALAHDLGVEGVTTNHTETCAGPCARNLSFVAPAPGTYNLYCSVHIDMKGQLVVTP